MKPTMTGGPELERALKELGGQVAGRLGARTTGASPTGTQFMNVAGAALGHSVSRQWAGYWQR